MKKKESASPFFSLRRAARNLSLASIIIIISLYIGMLGYRHFENMSWTKAYESAAMILSGMGPPTELHTDAGRIFAGTYALFCGIIFLVIIAVILVPPFIRFMHKLHLETKE